MDPKFSSLDFGVRRAGVHPRGTRVPPTPAAAPTAAAIGNICGSHQHKIVRQTLVPRFESGKGTFRNLCWRSFAGLWRPLVWLHSTHAPDSDALASRSHGGAGGIYDTIYHFVTTLARMTCRARMADGTACVG